MADEEGVSDGEEEKKDNAGISNPGQQPTEKIKKKRGRKPKSYYIQ
jgi:hypothetical protein